MNLTNKVPMQLLARLLCLILVPPTHVDVENIKVIEANILKRSAGQKDTLRLTTPRLQTAHVGFVGPGVCGASAVERWSQIPGTDIVVLYDVEAGHMELSQKRFDKHGRHRAMAHSGSIGAYKKTCERKDIDVIYIATGWVHHVPIALHTMNHGEHVVIEVPAATNVGEIWVLINTAERTWKRCMMLKNCVYDFFELSTLNMARQGLFDEVLHIKGAYIHNLEDSWDEYQHNQRSDFNHENRGNVYPIHGIGPDCQVLNIHRGDRTEYPVTMDTRATTGPKLVKKQTRKLCNDSQNGDQTPTLVRIVKEKTMLIQRNVIIPWPYNRMYQVVGIDDHVSKYPIGELAPRPKQPTTNEKISYKNLTTHAAVAEKVRDELLRQYVPQFIKDLQEKTKKVGGYGSMDYIMDYRLVYRLQNGLPLDMDVYDLAEWRYLGESTRLSIENSPVPVAVPSFTRGARKRINGFQYHFAP